MTVLGLGYRIQSNGKLRRKDREELIRLGDDKYNIDLDSTLTDHELIEHWNEWYQSEGNSHPDFIDETIKQVEKDERKHQRLNRKKNPKLSIQILLKKLLSGEKDFRKYLDEISNKYIPNSIKHKKKSESISEFFDVEDDKSYLPKTSGLNHVDDEYEKKLLTEQLEKMDILKDIIESKMSELKQEYQSYKKIYRNVLKECELRRDRLNKLKNQ